MAKFWMMVFAFALATTARAEGFFSEPAAYGGLGFAKHSFDDDGQFRGFSRDDKDDGLHLFGGYRFNRNFAVELSARYLGEYTVRSNTLSYKSEFTGITVGAVGMLPLGDNFSLYGRVGLGVVTLDERLSGSGYGRHSDDDSGGTTSLGLGVEYRPAGTNGLALRLGWETHFFTVETTRVVNVNGFLFVDDDEFDQRIDSFGLDIAYYFSL